jgi:methylglyoxal synthase
MTDPKTIALISHDGKKADMVAFAIQHKDVLAKYELVATSTTGSLIERSTDLKIH